MSDQLEIDIFDIDKFIKVNTLKEVTNPIMLEKDCSPTRNGLLSQDIFGRTPNDRRSIYAYIDLHTRFFHPYVFKVLKRVDRRFEAIVAGLLRVKLLPNGEMVEDENGETGLDFLYKNFKKIKFKTSKSNIRDERLLFINSLDINEIFCQKWVVQPAFFRDIQLSKADKGKISYNELNSMYVKLIRLSRAIQNDFSGISIIGDNTKAKIQGTLEQIYNNEIGKVKGKEGTFRKFVLGKSIDNSVRAVISGPSFKYPLEKPNPVNFYTCGLPLAMCCVLFYPFIVNAVKDYLYNEVYLRKANYPTKFGNAKVLNADEIVSDDYISKQIDLYIHSYGDRFKPIYLETDKGPIRMFIVGYNSDGDSVMESMIFNRPMTWTDLLYRVSVSLLEEKNYHVLITRYPLEDYFGTFPNKIKVLTTIDTEVVAINGKIYDLYPKIDPDLKPRDVSNKFIDTLNISNLYLQGLGADYDGDQVTIKGAWTQEANIELEKLLKSKKNILNIAGANVRSTEKEAVQTLYCLTKDYVE